ncbi:MAG: hypothetical protein Q9221_004080 [Calogaya cf. arnoldii]
MLGELYSSALALSAFNWECAPAVTELEIIVMDWLVQMFNLPSCYLSTNNGGGVMQGSTSEAVLALMVAARERYLSQTTAHLSGHRKEEAISHCRLRMVALGSEASHSCTEKAAMVLGIRYRSVPVSSEEDFGMTGAALAGVLQQCHEAGLEPFYLTATLGTTATCAVDRFDEIAHVLKGQHVWVHVDAAYAGAALVCEEYQHLTRHLGEFDSFSMSMSKWLLTNIDAVYVATMPVSNRYYLTDALSITPSYLRNDASDSGEVVDFRHWGVPLSRRFRALKVWFVIRTYGVGGLRRYVRNHIRMGEDFASLIATRPDLFKIVSQPAYALTVISIVPRIPAVLSRLLAAKAKEAIQGRANKDHAPQESVSYSGTSQSANGYPTPSNSCSSLEELGSLMNGVTYSNGLANGNSELKSDGNACTNGFQKSHTIGDSKSQTNYCNGDAMQNGVSNDVANGHATIDEVPHIKNDPASSLVLPSSHTRSPQSNEKAIDVWLTEYADMVTKEVYDLINRRGEIMLTSTVIGGRFVIRINGANPKTEDKYMRKAFEILVSTAEEVLG